MLITKIEAQKRHKNRSSVYLDHQFAFGISDFDLLRLHLKEGQELSGEEFLSIQNEILLQEARQYALKLLDRQSYTEKAMERKLFDHGCDADSIKKTIAFLVEYRYLDDADYVRRYVKSALHSGRSGMKKIRYDLMGKGVKKELLDEILSEFDTAEFKEREKENIEPLLMKRLKGDFSFPNVMKAKRYLLSRGFSQEVIDGALHKLTCEEEWLD